MRHQVLIASIAALAVAGEVAAAQPASTTVKPASPGLPIATTSFTPYVASGSLAGAPINLSLEGVSLLPTARLDGSVTFKPYNRSIAYLTAALPNGNYSVQLAFSRVTGPAVVTIARTGPNGAPTVMVSCSLVMSFNTRQACDSGAFTVANGQLALTLGVPSGEEITLANVTVSRWK